MPNSTEAACRLLEGSIPPVYHKDVVLAERPGSLMSFKSALLISSSQPHQDESFFFSLVFKSCQQGGKDDTVVRCCLPHSTPVEPLGEGGRGGVRGGGEEEDIFKPVSILAIITFQVDCNI